MGYGNTYVVSHEDESNTNQRLVCFDVRPGQADEVTLCPVGTIARLTLPRQKVRSVFDFDTGEILSGLDACLGEPPAPLEPGEVEKIRSRDKWLWDKPFMLRVIENHFRNKLYGLFDYRCFNCSRLATLESYRDMEDVPFYRGLDRDHHMPITLGGRLVPGNIVALCKACNSRKQETDPRSFYTAGKLAALRPIFARQAEALAFKFDPDGWSADRLAYLRSLGIGYRLVDQVLHNETHRYYVGVKADQPTFSVSISVSLDDLLP
jgi:5-methylcytosine-specific restriction endonuclease McrA